MIMQSTFSCNNESSKDCISQATILYSGKKYAVKANELEFISSKGVGSYGCVDEMTLKHNPEVIMAVKRVRYTGNEDERKIIEMDINTIKNFGYHRNIVEFYCVLDYEGDVCICMELLDISLDKFYLTAFQHKINITEIFLQRMAVDVISALRFLQKNQIIHRDVKPSNILLSRKVIFKMCDFGISGILVDSVSKTFNKGCRPYFAPERILRKGVYSVKSDIWSLGITFVEVTTGRHPYHGTVFEMLKQITSDEIPKLPDGLYSTEMEDFVSRCLTRDASKRPEYKDLLLHDWIHTLSPFIQEAEMEYTEKLISLYKAKLSNLLTVKQKPGISRLEDDAKLPRSLGQISAGSNQKSVNDDQKKSSPHTVYDDDSFTESPDHMTF